MKRLLIQFSLILCVLPCLAEPQDWTKQDTLKREGNKLTLVCYGEGPSLDIARRQALDQCHTTAANQISSDLTIKSLSVETERSANYHQEVSAEQKVENLICIPENEKFESENGNVKLFIKCAYDLKKAKVTSLKKKDELSEKSMHNPSEPTKIKNEQIPVLSEKLKKSFYIQSDNRQIIVTTIPQCEDILITGGKSRSLKCNENPNTIFVEPADTKLILRLNGFKPKHVDLNQLKNNEMLEVYFEKI